MLGAAAAAAGCCWMLQLQLVLLLLVLLLLDAVVGADRENRESEESQGRESQGGETFFHFFPSFIIFFLTSTQSCLHIGYTNNYHTTTHYTI